MVPIVSDGDAPLERCCICRKVTSFWTVDRNPLEAVALCEGCAKRAESFDIPTKSQWIRRERIASRRIASR